MKTKIPLCLIVGRRVTFPPEIEFFDTTRTDLLLLLLPVCSFICERVSKVVSVKEF
jgi:hypothetical protein